VTCPQALRGAAQYVSVRDQCRICDRDPIVKSVRARLMFEHIVSASPQEDCTPFLGEDFACPQYAVAWDAPACQVKGSHEAVRLCKTLEHCVGVVHNRERTVGTLKARFHWSASQYEQTIMTKCRELATSVSSDVLQGKACGTRTLRLWWSRDCAKFTRWCHAPWCAEPWRFTCGQQDSDVSQGLSVFTPDAIEHVLCVALVAYPFPPTMPLLEEQLSQCGGRAIFSAVEIPKRSIFKLHPPGAWNDLKWGNVAPDILVNTSRVVPTQGYALHADRLPFEVMWNAVYQRFQNRFRWYVKVDADTVFFPNRLPSALRRARALHPGDTPVMIGTTNGQRLCGAACGPLYGMSSEALARWSKERERCHRLGAGRTVSDAHALLYQEDVYFSRCAELLRIPVVPGAVVNSVLHNRCPHGTLYAENLRNLPAIVYAACMPCGDVVAVHPAKSWHEMKRVLRAATQNASWYPQRPLTRRARASRPPRRWRASSRRASAGA
jgi:hypothetical protein